LIGEILLEQENFLEAIVAYRRLTELTPEDAKAYYNLGIALKKRDRTDEAIAALKKARELYQRQGKKEGTQQAESLLQELKKSNG
jgi:Flp pilus assembly protein TadD